MPAPISEEKRKQKQIQILEAAAAVFARKGYTGTVMADIAVQAGIGKGTIYEYFPSKDALFFGVFEWLAQKINAAAMTGPANGGDSAANRLTALSRTIMSAWRNEKELFALVLEFWSAASAPDARGKLKAAFHQLYHEFRTLVTAIIKDGVARKEFRRDIEAESVAAALVGCWDALLLQAWFDETFDASKAARDFIPLVISGMTGKRDGGKG